MSDNRIGDNTSKLYELACELTLFDKALLSSLIPEGIDGSELHNEQYHEHQRDHMVKAIEECSLSYDSHTKELLAASILRLLAAGWSEKDICSRIGGALTGYYNNLYKSVKELEAKERLDLEGFVQGIREGIENA